MLHVLHLPLWGRSLADDCATRPWDDMFVGVCYTVWGPTVRLKRDTDLQRRGLSWFSTCHDGLLAPQWGAITRGPDPLAGRLETRHHTRGVTGPAGCFSRTLSASLQLCRKCSNAPLRRTTVRLVELPILNIAGLQHGFDEVDKAFVVDFLL